MTRLHRRLASLMATACAASTAWGLGPSAPFVPPGREAVADFAQGLPTAAGEGHGLTGVRLGRHAGALVDGAWIAQGQPVRGARLEAVHRDHVVLRHADGRAETLDLYPAAAATAASSAASAPPAASTATAQR